jgi:hypothetical protein
MAGSRRHEWLVLDGESSTSSNENSCVVVRLCVVTVGGFDGRAGWVQSKLLVKPTATQFVSSSPIPNLARTLSTRTQTTGGRKALPAPSK